jgi:hypothetical protein
MKKIILIMTLLLTSVFGFNYNGTWVNNSPTNNNDPLQLKITNSNVTPYIKRGVHIARLKTKKATNTGRGLFEAWGYKNRNLALFIKPINSYTIKVYAKKINVVRHRIVTKTFIFKNKSRLGRITTKKRYAGSWVNQSPFSAISRLRIKQKNGQIIVNAWRPTRFGEQYLGAATARVKGSKLYLNWKRDNIAVTANITGLNYNRKRDRYNKLKLNLTASNSRNGVTSSQTIYLRRANNLPEMARPLINKHLKVGPLDINIMTNSY